MRALLAVAVLLLLVTQTPGLPWTPGASAQQGKPPVFITLRVELGPNATERVTYDFVYETCFYSSRFRDFFIPTGMTVTRLRDDDGHEIPILRQGNGTVDFDAPYACNGRKPLRFDLVHAPAATKYAPVYRGNTTIGAYYNNLVTVEVRAQPGVVLTHLAPGGRLAADGRSGILWSNETQGSGFDVKYVDVVYAWEDRDARDWRFEDVAPLRLVTPESFATAALRVTHAALAPTEAARAEAGLPHVENGTFALFTHSRAFLDFEAGHYSGRRQGEAAVIALKLDHVREEGATFARSFEPLQGATGTLVHEAFHAMSIPVLGDFDRVGWWVEGTANHAEAHSEAMYRAAAAQRCVRDAQSCEVRSDAILYADLVSIYDANATFDTAWKPRDDQPAAQRRLMYDHSRLIVDAYVQRAGGEAYRSVWGELIREAARSGCACNASFLERALLAHANGTLTPEELYFPYRGLFHANRTAFDDAIRPFAQRVPAREAPPSNATHPAENATMLPAPTTPTPTQAPTPTTPPPQPTPEETPARPTSPGTPAPSPAAAAQDPAKPSPSGTLLAALAIALSSLLLARRRAR